MGQCTVLGGSLEMRWSAGGVVAAALLLCGAAHADGIVLEGDEPSFVDLGAGAFNILGTHDKPITAEGRLEYRDGDKLWGIGPAAGLLVNGQGGVFGYAGVYADLRFGRFVMTPLLGVGGYDRGHSEELGGTFEFRLSATFAYEFDNKSRLGVQFGHISNAGIHYTNPSDDEVLVSYSIPLGD